MFLPSSLDPTWKSVSIYGFLSGKRPLHTWPQQCCNLLLLYFSTIMCIWDIPTYPHFKLQEWLMNQNPLFIVFPCKLATFPTILSPGWVLVDVVNLGAIGAAISSSLGHGFLMCFSNFNWGTGCCQNSFRPPGGRYLSYLGWHLDRLLWGVFCWRISVDEAVCLVFLLSCYLWKGEVG